jgi:hypothetical protein
MSKIQLDDEEPLVAAARFELRLEQPLRVFCTWHRNHFVTLPGVKGTFPSREELNATTEPIDTKLRFWELGYSYRTRIRKEKWAQ